ncbi:MAG: sulfite exporter TauE/SafE family protein [Phycisphaerae bacterium]
MIALLTTVLIASLLGSAHCAGMCGPFVAIAVGAAGPAGGRRAPLQIAYHAGRWITYAIFGALAGGLGAALNHAGALAGVQRAATIFSGALMLTMGVVTCLRHFGWRIGPPPIANALQRLVMAGHRAALPLTPTRRALAIGCLTTLLPCGWLYAFAITSAGAGSPLAGALTMTAFWLGTLPMLVALGFGVARLRAALGRHSALIASLAIVVVGLFTVLHRAQLPSLDATASAAVMPASAEQAATDADALNSSDMPCCKHEHK